MRASLVLLLVAACGARPAAPPPAPGTAAPATTPPPATVPPAAPSVASPASLAAADGAPPIVVLIDAKGQRYLAAAASWADLSAGRYSSGPKAAGADATLKAMTEVHDLGLTPKEVVDRFVDFPTEREIYPGLDHDDPPPPEEAEEDESGGTGTAMALEEGKMARHPPGATDPIAGQRGWIPRRPRRPDAPSAPARLATIAGEVISVRPADVPAIVVPAPAGKAAVLVHTLTLTHGMIAVAHDGQLRPLRIAFHARRDVARFEPPSWLEARLEPTGIVVEAVPSPSTTVAWSELPAGQLTAALAQARDRHQLAAHTPVDVLVTPELDVQRLIDALLALDAAGAQVIGLGLAPAPDSAEAKLRGRALPTITAGVPNAQGDLDKAAIRAKVREHQAKLTHCYDQALLAKPGLSGTVMVQFLIGPDGKVKSATASGVDPDLASCVAAAVRKMEFPKPQRGGNVQVNYPFIFRQ